VVFSLFAMAAVTQVIIRPLGLRTQVTLGAVFLALGIATLAFVVVTTAPLGYFFLGGIIAGAGAGALFKAALAIAGTLAEPAHRGEVLAGVFLIAYIGLTIPVVGIGVATVWVSLPVAFIGFAVVIIAIALLTAIPLIRRLQHQPA
jgi:dipeptide/tripeptide permease